jgi:hypothetical protein
MLADVVAIQIGFFNASYAAAGTSFDVLPPFIVRMR